MSRLFSKPEKRSISSVPWNVSTPLNYAVSQDKALALTPVFAANRHITDFCSTLPLKAYRRIDEEERQPIPLPPLFSSLKSRGLLIPWIGQGVSSLAIRGNAVGLITSTDGFGFPTSIAWVCMDRVYVDDTSGAGKWFINGRPVARPDLVHIPWITVPGRTLALSPIEYYAATINAGTSAQGFGNDWFAGGGFPPAVFRNIEETVPPEAASQIRQRLMQAIRRREPLVTGRDWEYTPVSIPPEQAQFIETQKLSANQVASIYGIDPDEVGGEAANGLTYSNEETRQIKRAANMRPYLARFEEAFAAMLPERQYVKFNTDATIRVDTKTRHDVYKIQYDIGLTTPNERRAKEDLPPLPGGDTAVPAPVQQQPAEGARHLSVVNTEGDAHYG